MTAIHLTKEEQYLTFRLDKESFALAITKVKEVLDFTHLTKVPRTPDFVRGVINLRGNVVSVVDLRMNLGMGATEITEETGIIILESEVNHEVVLVGALVDALQAVVGIPNDRVAPPPKLGTHLNTEFVLGIGKTDDMFRIIIDIDRIIEADEQTIAAETANQLEHKGMTGGEVQA